ncbi:HPr family phosphocarrier protein, partial [candidate division KSB1 bacterium]
VNGKSIMGLMMIAAEKDSILTLKIFGEDEEEAMNELVNLINNKFEE